MHRKCSVLLLLLSALHLDAADIESTQELMKFDSSASQFTQLFSVQAGLIKPRSVEVSNGDYDFQYGSGNLSAVMTEIGWAVKLFDLHGSIQLEEGLSYTNFSGKASSSVRGTGETPTMRLDVLGLDSRLMYSMDWFPWERLIPFVDAGYLVGFYNQASSTDLESASGSTGNLVAGAGVRFWLNRGGFTNGDFIAHVESIPVFVTLKYNRIFENNQSLDLGSDFLMGGIQIGL